jgi:hypothetical protein
MATNVNKILLPLCPKFYCKYCDYGTSKKSSYESHIRSMKHNGNVLATNGNKILPKLCSNCFTCENCDKKYTERTGLWKHNKKCIKKEYVDNDKIDFLKNENKEILDMLKHQINDNTDFRKQIVDIVSKQNETINTLASKAGNHITNNKTFNLNVFLNDTCKGAINMTDFVNSIQLQLSDLETTGQLGYVQGITKIFLNNLNGLNTHDRPIHCSDFKREILYIKDNNEWTKEEDDKLILQKAIKDVANKNIKQISEWVKTHPDCYDSESKQNDKYLKIVSNAMSGGSKEEQHKNIQLIIKNLAKEVVIEKNSLI